MTETARAARVRACYDAFANDRREVVEAAFTVGFTFSSPPDPLLDRAGFFERCWPGAGRISRFDIVRLVDRTSMMEVGSVGLGEFVPYRKVGG